VQDDLWKKADELERRSIFLGGPKHKFIFAGRCQLEILLKEGLAPDDFVLNVGCGVLRGGWWLINFLRPGRYFGIEPNKEMLTAGTEVMLDPELLAEKRPGFSNNDDFDFSVFKQKFEFVIARSVWTHTSKSQMMAMLQSFLDCTSPKARLLTSIVEPKRGELEEYDGAGWLGRSHQSAAGGMAHHRFESVEELCQQAGLKATRLDKVAGQRWIRIDRPGS
jgi:hypothetical protein